MVGCMSGSTVSSQFRDPIDCTAVSFQVIDADFMWGDHRMRVRHGAMVGRLRGTDDRH